VSQSDFVSRGQALVAAGQFQEAVKVCRLGLLGRPTTVEGRVVLGQALLALKRYDEVLAEMRVALELDHGSVASQVLKAEALLRKGDVAPAIEALQKARQMAPGDARITQLLAEADSSSARPSVTHPAVGFIGSGDTKHYPGHPSGDENSVTEGFQPPTANFTKPTSMASPAGPKRSSKKRDPEPEPDSMSVPGGIVGADPTGTVEVDPDLEGVEVDDDVDFDELAAPPVAAKPNKIGGARGAVVSSRADDGENSTAIGKKKPALFEDDDDDDDLAGAKLPKPPAARNPAAPTERAKGKTVPPPRSKGPSAAPPAARVPLPAPMPAAAMPPAAPLPPAPRAPALPGMTAPPPAKVAPSPAKAAPPPAMLAPPPSAPTAAPFQPPPSRPMPASQPPPARQPELFNPGMAAPAWGAAPAPAKQPAPAPRAVPNQPAELDSAILALMAGQPEANPVAALDHSNAHGSVGAPAKTAIKTGMRKTRSRLSLFLWIVVGAVVIGGGVFAGFEIRAMRLEKQIIAARERATDLAKADTWKGWRDARESLASIVQASPTLGNRTALARTRALVAYEFGDGLVDAKTEVDGLAGEGGLDGAIAAGYLALAKQDSKAAKAAADAAFAMAPDDAAAHYIAGQAALLAGDPSAAVTHLKTASDKDARPLFGVGLARAQAAAYSWDDALASLDKVFAGTPDHPAAVIARGVILTSSGRILAGSSLTNEIRAQLERTLTQGKRPLAEQQHGVSPAQVAFAYVTHAQVNAARNDTKLAKTDLRYALGVNLDDQRFAEDVTDTLYMLGELTLARSAVDRVIKDWPGSRRARIALARIMLAQGKASDAIDVITKQADVLQLADALAVRGQAHLSLADGASAAADFDAALKKVPRHEQAMIGRAWFELSTGDVEAATKRVNEIYNAKGSTVALSTVFAAIQRRSADAAVRDNAKTLLEKLVATSSGLDLTRAQLELARIYRDLGDYRNARPTYAAAAIGGHPEARLEYALLLIEDRDPNGGRDTLESLLKEAGERPSAQLVIEGARARMLVGDHPGAMKLLDLADKMPGVERWKLDRERGRLALRKSDFPVAAASLTRALDNCGGDAETFLLAADAGVFEKPLADKVKKLAGDRLKGRPEAKIVEAKLLLVGEKLAEAEQAYRDAKAGLKAEKASSRRVAQADFGLGLVAYIQENKAEALQMFELVMDQDPSLVDTYVFAADIAKDPKRAFQFAQKAVQYNPDYPGAWLLVGKIASRVKDRKALAQAVKRLTEIAPNGDELKELKTLPR
jgi:tetratricopeptide (TPR) repeat protein